MVIWGKLHLPSSTGSMLRLKWLINISPILILLLFFFFFFLHILPCSLFIADYKTLDLLNSSPIHTSWVMTAADTNLVWEFRVLDFGLLFIADYKILGLLKWQFSDTSILGLTTTATVFKIITTKFCILFIADYKILGILKRQFSDTPILGLTATATNSVLEDVKKILNIQGCMVYRASYNRANLYYEVNYWKTKEWLCVKLSPRRCQLQVTHQIFQTFSKMFEIQIFIAIFGILIKDAFRQVQTSLVLMQGILRLPLKF